MVNLRISYIQLTLVVSNSVDSHVLTDKFDLTNVNNMVFYISGPKLLFETTEISTHPNSTQQESNYIYLYTTCLLNNTCVKHNSKSVHVSNLF
jgi:hypothetical protein